MGLWDNLKAKADANGDGKIDAADLDALKDGVNDEKLNQLKELADRNEDGKLSLDDAKNLNVGELAGEAKDSAQNIVPELKNKLGDIFKSK